MEFCKNNDLQLIVRAHECVMDGFERFAQGHLITLFSATNYCGKCPIYRLQCLNWILSEMRDDKDFVSLRVVMHNLQASYI